MTFILVICAGLTLFLAGCVVGYLVGYSDAEQATYEAVDKWAARHHRS